MYIISKVLCCYLGFALLPPEFVGEVMKHQLYIFEWWLILAFSFCNSEHLLGRVVPECLLIVLPFLKISGFTIVIVQNKAVGALSVKNMKL